MKTMTRISRRVKPAAKAKTVRPFAEGLLEVEPAVPYGWASTDLPALEADGEVETLTDAEQDARTIAAGINPVVTQIRVEDGEFAGTYNRRTDRGHDAHTMVWQGLHSTRRMSGEEADRLYQLGRLAIIGVGSRFFVDAEAELEMEMVPVAILHDRPYQPSDVELAAVLGYDLARLGFVNVAADSTKLAVIQAFEDGYAQGEAEIERDMRETYEADLATGRSLLVADDPFDPCEM